MIERVVTSGTFSLDGGTWDVDNNVWLIGDDRDVLVVDAAHDADAIAAAVGARNVVAILCTHGHNDHVTVAPELSARLDAPILLHPGDDPLWRMTHPDVDYRSLADTPRITVADIDIDILHTPGHSPGSVSLHIPAATALFTGDTLFSGGPGATGRSYSDFDTIIDSIRDRLLTLPEETTVHTGHGDSTTIGTEKPALADWIARGH
ncbi:MBL fold metallo-hydrolase [Nocardia brasiliensis]|uniref:Hydrolase n=1 Tax=Nocardia brasiliensis (strain ATCC 700358 / HUJEG-1) TaxID=1133849 RepID=K0F4S1_NOCB7|nr:MBL fold metallo-hydrolase [Nocardia brasiliensis]AFU04215.1 hydrolase [Nocardia brasiliensis ATCC 700358]OCF91367.1 Zn-dependent hydrolase [Nocardia brasiliensis]